jgi:hypothetical protein
MWCSPPRGTKVIAQSPLALGFVGLEPFCFSLQYPVEFLDQRDELFSILLDRDKGAKFVDSVAIGPVHSERSIHEIGVSGMFVVERL